MRFMAIVAFCLMAILALVRGADTGTPRPADRPSAIRAALQSTPRPPARTGTSEPPRVEPQPPRPRTEDRKPPVRSAASATSPAHTDRQRGLTLRFASQQDFLRLVNRGQLRVFAFRDGEVLALGADMRFRPAAAPGRLHELLPETIPALLISALRGTGRDARYRWGIVMPDGMARQVSAYLNRGANGELVIDRFGEVRLREA